MSRPAHSQYPRMPAIDQNETRNSSLRVVALNIFFGASGRFWRALLQFVFTPVYIRLLGPESYGLVAFSATLTLTLIFLDQCISPVLIREFGRLGGRDDSAQEMCNLLRSLEIISAATAMFIGAGIVLAAPLLSWHWINASTLSQAELANAVRLMGVYIACMWPSFLYGSGFIALHRQDILTPINAIVGLVQAVGAALLLWLVSADILLFLAWQVVGATAISLVTRQWLWRIMPRAADRPRLDWGQLRTVWRFAAGTLVIGITTSLLTQADKLMVSKWVTLDRFAAYGISFFLASQVSALVIAPVAIAIQPFFAKLIADGDDQALAREYHRWTQVVVLLSLSVLGGLAVFAHPFLQLWLGRDAALVAPIAALLPWVLVGTILNSIMSLPFILQMAAGWVRLSILKNIVASALFLPALLIFVPKYGLIAGAGCWIALNAGYYLIETGLMHRRLLTTELWRWWGLDTVLPMTVAAGAFWGLVSLFPASPSLVLGMIRATLSSLAVFMILLLVLPQARELVIAFSQRSYHRVLRTIR